MIASELRVSDFIRHNVGDIQTIAEAQTTKVSYVSDARAFFDALENGATICLTPNTVINLSEVLNDPTYFRDNGRGWVDDLEAYHGNARIISDDVPKRNVIAWFCINLEARNQLYSGYHSEH